MKKNVPTPLTKQQGLSLIELSLLIVVLGIATIVVGHLYITRLEKSTLSQFNREVTTAHDSILGFVFANSRLPCPAATPDGQEDCQRTSGYLPGDSLGLFSSQPGQQSYPLRYALYNRAQLAGSDISQNMEMGILTDRFHIFTADEYNNSAPAISAQMKNLTNHNTLDFCQALQTGFEQRSDNRYLQAGNDPVAYILFHGGTQNRDGKGSLLDGENNDSDLTFEPAGQSHNHEYDDQTSVAYFSTLWERLGCKYGVSPSGRSLPNLLTSAVMYQYSLAEFMEFMKLREELAYADSLSAGAAVASATSGILLASAELSTGTAESINTFGIMAPMTVLAAVGLASATTAEVMAITAVSLTAIFEDDIKKHKEKLNIIQQDFNDLATTIRCRVSAAEKAGLYLNYQELEGDDCHF